MHYSTKYQALHPQRLMWNSPFVENTDVYLHIPARFHCIAFKITATYISQIIVYGHREEDKQVWKRIHIPSSLFNIYFIFSATSELRKKPFENKMYISFISPASSRTFILIFIFIFIKCVFHSFLQILLASSYLYLYL